jgi:AraC-like DNA-binding protein
MLKRPKFFAGRPEMIDPLAEVVTMLQPSASFSKVVIGTGAWRVHRAEAGRPFYCAILDGACSLTVHRHRPIVLERNDFVLVPAAHAFATSSPDPAPADDVVSMPTEIGPREFRLGSRGAPPNVRMLVGYCVFGSTDASLLVSLLPKLVHIRGDERLAMLVQLLDDEARQSRAARDIVLSRLLEVLLIEALRSSRESSTSPGLVRGLADDRLAIALRRMHERPASPWTVADLAKEASLSRSVFFERFRRTVGVAPMEYLLAWRMALAKDLLQREGCSVTEVAERVGYSSASTFSFAFSRHVGSPPKAYARQYTSDPELRKSI